ncbi:unnamed protein product [Vitrella brassicaformis CCMP3155]|uniref:Uncharacterized protein n=1 Tax=Vitrella brassicaformis (strain CCMP3155) TaxID=1169540 RepID=A0A0G4H396_VITBC|nr:unnamed protein product [Vitrella brassicaformis CCMP3155]|eukprot:CEM38188.1 unnamed protein product [Vitrella brassicaformis CCMP3155]
MARQRHPHEELWVEVAIRKLKTDARRHKNRKPRLKPNAHSAFDGFKSYMEVFGYLLHFSVTILLQCVIPRTLRYLEMTNGQCRMNRFWNILWLYIDILIIIWQLCPKFRWCIIIWCRVVVVPICQLIRATGRQPRIVDGRVNLYQQHGRWYIEMESGAPFLIPERFGTAAEIHELDQDGEEALRGSDRGDRDDTDAAAAEEAGWVEWVDSAKAAIMRSHVNKATYRPFLLNFLDSYDELHPFQWSEEVQAESYLITDPDECLGLLPALFGISDDSGSVPAGWDLSAENLQAIMGEWEQENPLPDDDEDDDEWVDEHEEARAIERRIRHAMRHNRNTHTRGHLRLSDTTRRIQQGAPRSRSSSSRSGRSSLQSRISRAGNSHRSR